MATGYIGKIESFDDSVESWNSYVERLEQYFTINEIDDEKKVPALLILLGGKTYGLLRNLTLRFTNMSSFIAVVTYDVYKFAIVRSVIHSIAPVTNKYFLFSCFH
jgi:hypothetical protein